MGTILQDRLASRARECSDAPTLYQRALMKLNHLLAGLSLTALACEPDPQTPPSLPIEIRDSAGIRIVENAQPPDGSRLPWRVGPEPAVSIGTADQEPLAGGAMAG